MLTVIPQRHIHEWQGKDVDKRQIRNYSTMCKGYEISERKTENKPIGTLMSFRGCFDLYFDHHHHHHHHQYYYCCYFIFSPGGFSETGCHVVTSKSNSEETVCSCNHLTHFAVLLDYNGSPGVMSLFSLTFSIGNRISLD